MGLTSEPERFFTRRAAAYSRFIRWMRYPQGLRAFLVSSPLLRPDLRILDAGCGTGAVTLAVYGALSRRTLGPPAACHGFDLTGTMLQHYVAALELYGLDEVEVARANVLELESLPAHWTDYDLIVSASMLEYVPRERFVEALRGLCSRLREGGHLLLFITRRNALMRLLIGFWWASNLYAESELLDAFRAAGFSEVTPRRFPPAAQHLALWGHVIEARR